MKKYKMLLYVNNMQDRRELRSMVYDRVPSTTIGKYGRAGTIGYDLKRKEFFIVTAGKEVKKGKFSYYLNYIDYIDKHSFDEFLQRHKDIYEKLKQFLDTINW